MDEELLDMFGRTNEAIGWKAVGGIRPDYISREQTLRCPYCGHKGQLMFQTSGRFRIECDRCGRIFIAYGSKSANATTVALENIRLDDTYFSAPDRSQITADMELNKQINNRSRQQVVPHMGVEPPVNTDELTNRIVEARHVVGRTTFKQILESTPDFGALPSPSEWVEHPGSHNNGSGLGKSGASNYRATQGPTSQTGLKAEASDYIRLWKEPPKPSRLEKTRESLVIFKSKALESMKRLARKLFGGIYRRMTIKRYSTELDSWFVLWEKGEKNGKDKTTRND